MSSRRDVLCAYFVLGGFATCAQAILLREMQVLAFGLEWTWGLVLAFWLAGVGVGAYIAGRNSARPGWPLRMLALASVLMPWVLGGEILLVRSARSLAGTGPGEFLSPVALTIFALAAALPTGLCAGIAYPSASTLMSTAEDTAGARARGAGWIYLVESLGSLAGGCLFSLWLVSRIAPIQLAASAEILLGIAMSFLCWRRSHRRLACAFAAVSILLPAWLLAGGRIRQADESLTRARFNGFAAGLELVRAEDTPYENLAIGRLEDQYSLYLNGRVAATWPDPETQAISAHLAACEAPAPRRMLVIGGGAEGLLGELLRHRPERLDFLTQDERVLALARETYDAADRRALSDPALRIHTTDARRFLTHAVASDTQRYDLVMITLAEPASVMESRMYTTDCFREISSILDSDGVLSLRLGGSIGYWSAESAEAFNCILESLREVFPETILTFEDPVRIFAAKRPGVLTDSGAELAARYRRRHVESPEFAPSWFLGVSDVLDADERNALLVSLAEHPAPIRNTDERPVAALLYVRVWLKAGESIRDPGGQFAHYTRESLDALLRVKTSDVLIFIAAATLGLAALSRMRGRRAFATAALGWSVGTTGFAAMTFEVLLLYTFQLLYGIVYERVGLVIGLFMSGLVLGSGAMNLIMRRWAAGPERKGRMRLLAGLDVAQALFAALLPLVVLELRQTVSDVRLEGAIFAMVAAAGCLCGFAFPLALRIALDRASRTGQGAAFVATSDYVGAAAGALAAGTLLMPVLGVTSSAVVVVALKLLSAGFVGVSAGTPLQDSPASGS